MDISAEVRMVRAIQDHARKVEVGHGPFEVVGYRGNNGELLEVLFSCVATSEAGLATVRGSEQGGHDSMLKQGKEMSYTVTETGDLLVAEEVVDLPDGPCGAVDLPAHLSPSWPAGWLPAGARRRRARQRWRWSRSIAGGSDR